MNNQQYTTLADLLIEIDYNNTWGIWAESASPDAKARYGQKVFENGGVLDDMIYITDGETAGDALEAFQGDMSFDEFNEAYTPEELKQEFAIFFLEEWYIDADDE